jgi:hypothetical protein
VYDAAKPKIDAVLARWGYPKGHVDIHVDADLVNDKATIVVAFDPGPLCTFGPITIKGTDGALADAARARLSMKPGARYSGDDMSDSRARLYDMHRFATVRIEPDLSDGTVVPILISVDESTEHELRLGGGVGMNPASYEIHGRAGYTITAIPGDLDTTHLELKPALVRLRETGAWQPRVEALVSVEHLDLFRPLMIGTAEVGYQWMTVEGYTSTGPHVQLGLKTPLYRRYLQASAAWHLEELNFRALSPALPPDLRQSLGLLSPQRLGYYE